MTKNAKTSTKKKPAPKKLENDLMRINAQMFEGTIRVLGEQNMSLLASFRAATTSTKRKELLARVAGSIAAGLVTSPSPSIASPSSMATVAVDIAEEILKQTGIPSAEHSAESQSSTGAVGVGAAS